MLYIEGHDKSGRPYKFQWHIGEGVPEIVSSSYVVKFQGDGDELDALLYGMEHFRKGWQAGN